MEFARRRPILTLTIVCIVTLSSLYISSKFLSSKRTPFSIPSWTNSSTENFESYDLPLNGSANFTDEMQKKQKNEVRLIITPHQLEEFMNFSLTANKKCYQLINLKGWETEKVTSHGDTIYLMTQPWPVGKIYKIKGTINAPPATIIDEIFEGIENMPSWNEQTEESKIIHKIDKDTDLIYQTTPTLASGAVSPRDFLHIRHRGKVESYYMFSSTSPKFFEIPERDGYVRGENGFNCLAARNLANGTEDKSEFIWIYNGKLNGWLLKYVVDLFIPNGMENFMKSIRRYLVKN